MKSNVTRLPQTEIFSEQIPGTLPYPLWAIKYVSGVDEGAATKPGDWLVQWEPTPERVTFAFARNKNLYYIDQASAQSVSDALRSDAGIETEIVKIGG
jgi:hypothetical protein